jgi:hypothetical protein
VSESFVIQRRFRGPADSGNGGYSAGMVARFLGGDAEVTLRRPPPLERPLTVTRDGERVLVHDEADLVAEGVATLLELAVPEAPTVAEAVAAARGYAGFQRHFFPGCFVCGPEREPGDGLRIFPGWLPGREVVTAPGRADPSLPADGGYLTTEIAWAFLDCPGAWAMERDQEEHPVVLGRMAAHLLQPIPVGAECVALGWPLGREGRKLFSGTALFAADGGLYGFGKQTWIVLG